MKKKCAVLLLSIAAVLVLSACSVRADPPPDLTGHWVQPGDSEWCHIATISENKIKIWWYLPAEDETNLYWSGTFVPPTSPEEPYEWQSVNDYSADYLDKLFKYRRTSREPVKTFTYKDGTISYKVTAGNLILTFALQKTDDPNAPIGENIEKT